LPGPLNPRSRARELPADRGAGTRDATATLWATARVSHRGRARASMGPRGGVVHRGPAPSLFRRLVWAEIAIPVPKPPSLPGNDGNLSAPQPARIRRSSGLLQPNPAGFRIFLWTRKLGFESLPRSLKEPDGNGRFLVSLRGWPSLRGAAVPQSGFAWRIRCRDRRAAPRRRRAWSFRSPSAGWILRSEGIRAAKWRAPESRSARRATSRLRLH